MLTYDHKTQVLYTCDVFGLHFCDDQLYDENLALIDADYQLYYDCLMARTRVRYWLPSSAWATCPPMPRSPQGMALLLHHYIPELVGRYRDWSQAQAKAETLVALFYAADYGYGDELAQAIAHGISKTGVAVELIDLKATDPQEVIEVVGLASGIVIGMPPQSVAHAALSTLLAAVNSKQVVGLFESGGGDDESVYPLRNKFQEIGVREAFCADFN